MLAYEDALAKILAALPEPIPDIIALGNAAGRVLLEPLDSPLDLPPFDNSAMDGYAVRAEDVVSARPEHPVRLRLAGRVEAGQVCDAKVGPGSTVRLFTGSAMPAGADAVVMQEDTRPAEGEEIHVVEPAKPGENVRSAGQDVKRDTRLLEPGQFLTAGKLSLLAAIGLSHVRVGRQPTVGVLATGSELKEPGTQLAPGQIYESNRIGLAALARNAGAKPVVLPLVRDEFAATRSALNAAFEQCDMVLTSGGVSVGEMDFVRQAFTEEGGRLEFWKVAIKPGRPFVFGQRGGKFLFGLPGNPVSAMVTFQLLVRPAVQRWQGALDVSLPVQAGVLAEALHNPGERRHFVRVRVNGVGNVYSAGLQASHALSSLAAANGLVDLAPGQELLAGTVVKVLRWE